MNLKKIFALGSYTHDILFNTANVSKQKNKNLELIEIQKIDDLFQAAHAYLMLKENNSKSFKHDLRLEGILQVIENQLPVRYLPI